jgi:hypothetical protein
VNRRHAVEHRVGHSLAHCVSNNSIILSKDGRDRALRTPHKSRVSDQSRMGIRGALTWSAFPSNVPYPSSVLRISALICWIIASIGALPRTVASKSPRIVHVTTAISESAVFPALMRMDSVCDSRIRLKHAYSAPCDVENRANKAVACRIRANSMVACTETDTKPSKCNRGLQTISVDVCEISSKQLP